MTSDKTKCFNQDGTIPSLLNGKFLKLVDKIIYLSSNISSIESDNMHIGKILTVINRKSDLSDKIKWEFFEAVAVSVLLYGCTTCALMKHLEEKLDENYTRMLHAFLNNLETANHPSKQNMLSTKDKLISDLLL